MANASPLQPLWDFVRLGLGDFTSSPAFILSAVMLGVYVPGLVFSVIDVFVTKRLTLKQTVAVYWRAMKWYSTFYVLAMTAFIALPLPMLRMQVPTEAPSVFVFARDLVLYFVLGDFCSYVWHRLEHRHRLYAKLVHTVHHFDKPPLSIWTAMVVHPVEGITVFFFFHIYGILGGIHPLTFAVAAFSLTAVTMVTHCGYRIPIYDRLFANSAGHDLHHAQREPTNVSVVFTICDRVFGTYRAT
jgi:sterol desaturase/sphingolipid hydroxylase (fatty acid hydroxylase superfamily)